MAINSFYLLSFVSVTYVEVENKLQLPYSSHRQNDLVSIDLVILFKL